MVARFGVRASRKIALDLGASTGGANQERQVWTISTFGNARFSAAKSSTSDV
jgi:hypothetical protein